MHQLMASFGVSAVGSIYHLDGVQFSAKELLKE